MLFDIEQYTSPKKGHFRDFEIDTSFEESSITEFVIEPIEEVESSITEVVIEPFGFNPYEVKKKGKVYTYWRYSYRIGRKVKHKHIGSYDRVCELKKLPIGKLRVILGLSKQLF